MAWNVIASLDAPDTAGEFTFNGLNLTGYAKLVILLVGVKVTTDDSELRLAFDVGGVEITSYRYVADQNSSSGSNTDIQNAAATFIQLADDTGAGGVGNAAEECFFGKVEVSDPNTSGPHKMINYQCSWTFPSGNVGLGHGAAVMEATGVIDGLRVFGESALTAGSVILLGLETA